MRAQGFGRYHGAAAVAWKFAFEVMSPSVFLVMNPDLFGVMGSGL